MEPPEPVKRNYSCAILLLLHKRLYLNSQVRRKAIAKRSTKITLSKNGSALACLGSRSGPNQASVFPKDIRVTSFPRWVTFLGVVAAQVSRVELLVGQLPITDFKVARES